MLGWKGRAGAGSQKEKGGNKHVDKGAAEQATFSSENPRRG